MHIRTIVIIALFGLENGLIAKITNLHIDSIVASHSPRLNAAHCWIIFFNSSKIIYSACIIAQLMTHRVYA